MRGKALERRIRRHFKIAVKEDAFWFQAVRQRLQKALYRTWRKTIQNEVQGNEIVAVCRINETQCIRLYRHVMAPGGWRLSPDAPSGLSQHGAAAIERMNANLRVYLQELGRKAAIAVADQQHPAGVFGVSQAGIAHDFELFSESQRFE